MEAAAAKAAADAAGEIIKQGALLGSLLVLALLGCGLLLWLLIKAWKDQLTHQQRCQTTIVELQASFAKTLAEGQARREGEVERLSRALSENASNAGVLAASLKALVETIHARTPIQEQMAATLRLMAEEWGRRLNGIEEAIRKGDGR
jgi:hypothetical protein